MKSVVQHGSVVRNRCQSYPLVDNHTISSLVAINIWFLRSVRRSRVVVNRLYKFTVTLQANRGISWNFKSPTIIRPIAKM